MYETETEHEAPTVGGKRDRTRQKLIQCASELVGEKGFERTTLEEVAKKAGVTRGSIYGNFKSREDLFMAVAASLWEPIIPPAAPGSSLAKRMELLAEAVIAALPQRKKRAVGAASFVAYALTHEELRTKIESTNEGIYAGLTAQLEQESEGHELPIPADQFVRVAHVLIEGIFSLHALTSGLIDKETVKRAFQILAGSEPS